MANRTKREPASKEKQVRVVNNITYEDKVAVNNLPTIDRKHKWTAEDANEVKAVVNEVVKQMVDNNSNQTIGGGKTFTNGIYTAASSNNVLDGSITVNTSSFYANYTLNPGWGDSTVANKGYVDSLKNRIKDIVNASSSFTDFKNRMRNL